MEEYSPLQSLRRVRTELANLGRTEVTFKDSFRVQEDLQYLKWNLQRAPNICVSVSVGVCDTLTLVIGLPLLHLTSFFPLVELLYITCISCPVVKLCAELFIELVDCIKIFDVKFADIALGDGWAQFHEYVKKGVGGWGEHGRSQECIECGSWEVTCCQLGRCGRDYIWIGRGPGVINWAGWELIRSVNSMK